MNIFAKWRTGLRTALVLTASAGILAAEDHEVRAALIAQLADESRAYLADYQQAEDAGDDELMDQMMLRSIAAEVVRDALWAQLGATCPRTRATAQGVVASSNRVLSLIVAADENRGDPGDAEDCHKDEHLPAVLAHRQACAQAQAQAQAEPAEDEDDQDDQPAPGAAAAAA